VVVLAVLLFDVVRVGAGRLGWEFLTATRRGSPPGPGMLPALVGTVWTLVLTAVIAFPLGVGTAIWLEEYAPDSAEDRHRDEHREPGRRAVHRLRHARPRRVRPLTFGSAAASSPARSRSRC
jgi:hypothetical protein